MQTSQPAHTLGKTVFGAALLCAIAACAAVSEERVATLEAQVAELKKTTSSGDDAKTPDGNDLSGRVAALESTHAESVTQLQQLLETLQGEVTALAASTRALPEAAASEKAAASGKGSGADVWRAARVVMGLPVPEVTADGDAFTVPRPWLVAELQALAMPKAKGVPKITSRKEGGIQLRGVKPKSTAGRLGLKNGDIIKSVGGSPVATAEDLFKALQAADGNVTVALLRKKKEKTLSYTLSE